MFLFGQFLPQLVRGQLEQLPEAQVREFQHSRRIRGTELLDPVALGIGPLAGLGPAVRTSPGREPAENFGRRSPVGAPGRGVGWPILRCATAATYPDARTNWRALGNFARSFRPRVTSILITGKGRGNPKAPMSGASIMA